MYYFVENDVIKAGPYPRPQNINGKIWPHDGHGNTTASPEELEEAGWLPQVDIKPDFDLDTQVREGPVRARIGAARPQAEIAMGLRGRQRNLRAEGPGRGGRGLDIGHIEDRCEPPGQRRPGARREILFVGEARVQEVDVEVDETRQDVQAARVEGLPRHRAETGGREGRDPLPPDHHVRVYRTGLEKDGSSPDREIGRLHREPPSAPAPIRTAVLSGVDHPDGDLLPLGTPVVNPVRMAVHVERLVAHVPDERDADSLGHLHRQGRG